MNDIFQIVRTYGRCTCNATSSPIKGTCLPFWGEGVVGVALNSSVGQKRWIYTPLPIQENIDLSKFKLYCSHSSFEHEKKLKNELDLRPCFLASVDLSGQGVYGQQNHKTPNWQKNSKIHEFFWKMWFCSLLWQLGSEESLVIICSYCRAWQYRLIDVDILKIQPLFEEL